MAVVPINPLVLKDIELLFGAEPDAPDFRKAVDQVQLAPSTSTITWTGLGGNTHSDQSMATWACTLNHAQDWDSDNSLSRYLFDNEGKTVPVTFRPRAGVGPSFKTGLVIAPGAIGGSVNSYAVTSVTLGCTGKPEIVPAPAPPAEVE